MHFLQWRDASCRNFPASHELSGGPGMSVSEGGLRGEAYETEYSSSLASIIGHHFFDEQHACSRTFL